MLASPPPTLVEPPRVYFDDNFRDRLIGGKKFGVTKGSKQQFKFEADLHPGSNSEDRTISGTSIRRLVRMRTG